MKKTFILSMHLMMLSFFGKAQQTDTLRLSLMEAVQLAVKQNQQLQSVKLDEDINIHFHY